MDLHFSNSTRGDLSGLEPASKFDSEEEREKERRVHIVHFETTHPLTIASLSLCLLSDDSSYTYIKIRCSWTSLIGSMYKITVLPYE
jgi:hypothetical protein